MAHAAPPPPGQHRRFQIIGAIVVVLGIALLAITIVSLTRVDKTEAGRTSQSASGTDDVSTSPASSPAAPTSESTTLPPSSTAPVPLPPTPTPTPTSPPAVAKVPLVVANNTPIAGVAAVAAGRFQAQGWQVTGLTNFRGEILSTCAYYDPAGPANQPAALELQREFPAIKRVEPRFAGLPAGAIVVVLTSDYS